MNERTGPSVVIPEWNRKILNAYWAVAALILITELMGFAMSDLWEHSFGVWIFISNHIVKPSLTLAGVLLLAEASNRYVIRYINDIIIATGALIPATLVYYHSDFDGIQFFFIIPLMVSIFYFQPAKVLVSFGTNFSLFLLLYAFHPVFRDKVDVMEFATTVVTMLCGLIIAYGIMARGAEIQRHLKETMEEQQNLLVKNILMDKLSMTDALTELYNHKTFHEYLDKLIDQSDQNKLQLHLAVMDIDNFKKINDTYGHWVGDLILKSVSQTIRSIVSMDDFAARYGGEEFAVIFTDKSTKDVLRISESIREKIAATQHPELNGGSVTISIGLKEYIPLCGKEWLFRGADEALYTAKRTGKNKTVLQALESSVLSC